MPRYLVIHADDFGLAPAVNLGILSAIQEGVVRSTSLLANFPAALEAADLARRHSIDVGWHLNLVQGKPCADPKKIPSLLDANGDFLGLAGFLRRVFLRRLRREELHRELSAQWEFFRRQGLHPSHVDGHLHVHAMPVVAPILRRLIGKSSVSFIRCPREAGGLGARLFARAFLGAMPGSRPGFWRETGARCLEFHGIALSAASDRLEAWEKTLKRIKGNAAEIMVHPAGASPEAEASLYGALSHREEELKRLLSPALRELIRERGFDLTSFRDLGKTAERARL